MSGETAARMGKSYARAGLVPTQGRKRTARRRLCGEPA
jgi:hypothetical protein